MTLAELFVRMDSREFSEWKAFSRYFEPFGDEWRQTALIMLAALTPYLKKDAKVDVRSFMPIADIPQTQEELAAEISKMILMQRGAACLASPEDPETPSA